MRLISLHLINFKGIKDFTFTLNGENATVEGDNGTGKTTLADAFLWLLFGKNSKNQKDFEVKTLDGNGAPIHGLNHEVIGQVQFTNEPPTELRRVFSEKWTKKRGSAERELTGHTTDYYVNGVPMKEKEYKEYISGIIDEDTFRMLVDPYYFSETLSWQDRRSLLFEVCGNVEDKDVINSSPDLADLTTILNGRSVEDHKKIVKAKRTEINQELQNIPVRIDEANRSLGADEGHEKGLVDKIGELRDQLAQKHKEMLALEQGGGVAEKEKVLAEIGNQLYRLKLKHETVFAEKKGTFLKEISSLEAEMDTIDRKVGALVNAQDYNETEIERLEARMMELRGYWHQVDISEFTYESENICPTCGQTLPEEKICAARESALAEFNRMKSVKLEQIQADGISMRTRVDALHKTNADAAVQIKALKDKREAFNRHACEIDKRIEAVNRTADDYLLLQEHINLSSQRDALNDEIDRLKKGINWESIATIGSEIDRLNESIAEIEGKFARIRQGAMTRKRIDDLKAQERNLAKEYERLEGELALLDLFTITKVGLIDCKINSHFNLARFKLFSPLINGGLEDCCEVMDKNGVPYSTALNKGAQINIGLDIINTLAKHHGFSAPIFIDNSEAVTDIIRTEGQQIRLYVVPGQTELKVITA